MGVALVLIWAVSSISVFCLICKEHIVLFQLPHFSLWDCTSWLKVRLENPFHPELSIAGHVYKWHHYQEKSKCTSFWIEESFSALGYSFDLQSIGDTVERTGLNQVNWDPQLPDLLGLESSSWQATSTGLAYGSSLERDAAVRQERLNQKGDQPHVSR